MYTHVVLQLKSVRNLNSRNKPIEFTLAVHVLIRHVLWQIKGVLFCGFAPVTVPIQETFWSLSA